MFNMRDRKMKKKIKILATNFYYPYIKLFFIIWKLIY